MMTWRTIAIMTGEEPIMQNATRGGVSNRTLEIYGAPFDDEMQAVEMHRTCDDHCGWAGPHFVRCLLENKNDIEERYREWLQHASSRVSKTKQANAASIALLALADESASKWLWGLDEDEARRQSEQMVEALAGALSDADQENDGERALQFVKNWVVMNWKCFQGAENAPIYGWIEEDCVCVIPSALREALENAKFSSRKALRSFSESGLLRRDAHGKYSIPKRNPRSKMLLRVHVFPKAEVMGDVESFEAITEDDEELPFTDTEIRQESLPF